MLELRNTLTADTPDYRDLAQSNPDWAPTSGAQAEPTSPDEHQLDQTAPDNDRAGRSESIPAHA
jgi:hypothetical protein